MIDIFSILFPVILILVAATMLVNRAGASRVFFDVVGAFQAERLIADVDAKMGVVQSLVLDGLSGIGESVTLVTEQMDMLVDATVPLSREVAEARLEFEKFAGQIQDSESLRQDIIAIGETFGFTAAQAMDAGSRMAQLSGVFGGTEAVGAATEAGIQFGMIGGMETGDAMKKLIQLHQQTNALTGEFTKAQFNRMSAEQQANVVRRESAKLLDELNTIENRSAATMSQVTHVMNQFASSGQLAGESISFMASMSATLIEAGEEQGKAGRALRMMYARLGANTGENAEILAEYGIATKDATGNLRSMEDIMHDITNSAIMNSEAEKLRVAQAIAGNDHYVRALKLMDGYGRAVQLNTLAIGRQDSALDEVNKKLEDQEYILQQAEAALMNSKAAIGDQLVPVVIHATKEQTRMNQAIAEILSTNSLYADSVMKLAFVIKNYMQMYAPLGEALLNVLSLNVALKTQQTIMRTLGQQEIIRANAYGGRTAMQQASLNMLNAELSAYDRIARVRGLSHQLGEAEMLQRNVIGQATQTMSLAEEIMSRKKITSLTKQHTLQKQGLNEARMLTESLSAEERARYLGSAQVHADELARLKGINTEEKIRIAIAKQRLDAGRYAKFQMANDLENQRAAVVLARNENFQKRNKLAVGREQSRLNALILAEEKALEVAIGGSVTKKHMLGIATKQNVDQLAAQIRVEQAALAASFKLEAGNRQRLQTGKMLTQEQRIMNSFNMQGISITAQKIPTQMKASQIDKLAAQAARELAVAYNMEAAEMLEIVMLSPQYVAMQGIVTNQAKKQAQTQQMVNSVMMGTTGILGGLSMILSMVSDDADVMRFSMILMMMSMIPMTFQMFKTAGGAATAAMGITGMGVAMDKAAISARRLKVALASTGLGLLAVGIGYAFTQFMDFDDGVMSADQVTQDFADTIEYTAEQYNNFVSALQTESGEEILSFGTVIGEISDLQTEISDLEDQLGSAISSTNKKFLQERIDMKKQELEIAKDLLEEQAASSLYDDPEAAKEFFQAVKDEPNLGLLKFLEKMASYEGDDFVLQTMAKTGQEGIDDILSQIAPEMRGIALETALAADNFEDFYYTIGTFVDHTNDKLGKTGEGIHGSLIGPIEAAKEAVFEFANAREEMFFGMAKGNITGEMVKQVVNKGVETLINTVEVVQTNNFNGMTTKQAADAIVTQIEQGLTERGINLEV